MHAHPKSVGKAVVLSEGRGLELTAGDGSGMGEGRNGGKSMLGYNETEQEMGRAGRMPWASERQTREELASESGSPQDVSGGREHTLGGWEDSAL